MRLKMDPSVSLHIVIRHRGGHHVCRFLCLIPSWSNHSHRGWTTLISFALQTLALSAACFCCPCSIPKDYRDWRCWRRCSRLPRHRLPPLPRRPNSPAAPRSNLMGDRLMSPAQIPPTVTMLTETTPPPPMVDPSAAGIRHGIGDPSGRGTVVDSVLGSDLVLPPPPPAVHHPPVSRMMEGNLIYRVQPDYPSWRGRSGSGPSGAASDDQP